jgi:hypothetical protein
MFTRHVNNTYGNCGKFWWLNNSKKAVNCLTWYDKLAKDIYHNY